MLHPVTIFALVGVACAPAPSTADAVAHAAPLSEEAEADSAAEGQPADKDADAKDDDNAPPKDGAPDAPKDEAPKDEAPKDEAPKAPDTEEPPDVPPPPPEPTPQLPPSVSTGEVKFINGEVPKVESFLTKMQAPVAKCVLDHGGMAKESGSLEIQFLVRVRGKAEGVEVLERDGISLKAERCIRLAFKNEWVGTPTRDPTGVIFTYSLERRLDE